MARYGAGVYIMKFVKYGSVAVAPVMLGRVGLRSMPSALS
jgi:hypothetical protein